MPPREADLAVSRFADALIWNWLIGGTDAHAKNYSLLLADKQVRLAPMYDVASALPYGTHEKKLRLAMKIGGDYRVFPERNTWPGAAKDLGLKADALVARVRELTAAAPEAFAESARAADIKALDRELPATLVDVIADRAARCMRLLGT
jgi:serine/threonine-protein kinase HipA